MRQTTISTLFALSLAACGDDASPGSDATDVAVEASDTTTPDSTSPDVPMPDTSAPDVTSPDTREPEVATPDTANDVTIGRSNTCTAPSSAAVADAKLPAGFCASVWAQNLDNPRGLFVAADGDVLVVERGLGQVTALWDADRDGLSGTGERAPIVKASGLNHGVSVHGGFLYASSSSTVFRWAYAPGTRTDLGNAEVVVKGMPGSGGHTTRTLVFDAAGRLYVSCGSASNVDANSARARIRRFDLGTVPSGGIAFDSGEVFADGLRNEVGLTVDGNDKVWGVQNGIDLINRDDLGGDIHEDNPAEILSRFDTAGAFHGYPYCWTEYSLPANVGKGPGTMWAHESTMKDGTHSDAWCQNPANVDPPELAMQAHSAPLDLEFYNGTSFPESYRGDLFITFHGSWNRDQPTGYKVVHVDIDASGHPSAPESFFEYAGQDANGWPHRPVGIRVGHEGQLFVTSDASDRILVIGNSGD